MRRFLISCIAFVAGISICQAQISGPGAWVPGPANPGPGSSPMPYYFSATNCRASGVINPVAGRNIVWIWLSINDEVVKEEYPDWNGLSVGLGVTFDSTHFAPGSTVTVSIDGFDDFGGVYHAEGSSVVKNRALLYDGYVSPPGDRWLSSDFVQGLLQSSGHQYIYSNHHAPWSPYNLLDDMGGSGVQEYASIQNSSCHGNVGIMFPWVDPAEYLFASPNSTYPASLDFLTYRTSQMGTGELPPYNPSEKTPINFAHLDSCDCGVELSSNSANDFQTILYPYFNYYGEPKYTDQAVIAYDAFIAFAGGTPGYFNINNISYVPQELRRTQPLLSTMANGQTAKEARLALIDKLVAWNIVAFNHTWILGVELYIETALIPSDIVIGGDEYTRTSKVYTGDTSNPVQEWYQ